jgi:putative nucleotidyltransferase with HDIG domain
MRRTGLLQGILPELLEGILMRQNAYHRYTVFRHVMETLDRVESSPVMRLTALLHDIAKPRVREKRGGQWRFLNHEVESAGLAKTVMERLRFDKGTISRVCHLIRHHLIGYGSEWTDAAVRRFIRRVGEANVDDLLSFRKADLQAHGMGDGYETLLNELEERVRGQREKNLPVQTASLAVSGEDVMKALDLSPGPDVGRVLDLLMEKVLDHPEWNNRERLLSQLKTMK